MNALPDNHPRLRQVITLREAVARHKEPKARPEFKFEAPLHRGWMLPYLLRLDDLAWGRWEHWALIMERGSIGDEPIPQIEWSGDRMGPGRRMFEKSLSAVTKYGDWTGWSSWVNVDYFLDWLLFGFGKLAEEPKPPGGCEGASERLYQIFNLGPALAFPHDYLGDILAENNFGRRSGFFPTPMDICAMMVKLQTGDCEDLRAKSVCDPALGTGRMLLAASNYSYRLFGNDISQTVIKAALVNGYLYAPWLVKPFPFLEVEAAAERAAEVIETIKPKELPPVGQLELLTV